LLPGKISRRRYKTELFREKHKLLAYPLATAMMRSPAPTSTVFARTEPLSSGPQLLTPCHPTEAFALATILQQPKPGFSSGLLTARKIFAVYHPPSNCIYIIIITHALRALAELINLESHEGDYA
jgi:hypothetical protein